MIMMKIIILLLLFSVNGKEEKEEKKEEIQMKQRLTSYLQTTSSNISYDEKEKKKLEKEKKINCSKEGYYIKNEIEGKMKLDYFKIYGIKNEEIISNRININKDIIIHTFNLKNESILIKYNIKNGNIIFKKIFKNILIESNLIDNENIYLSGKSFDLKENEPKEYFNFFRSFIDKLSGHSFKKIYTVFIIKLNLNNGE